MSRRRFVRSVLLAGAGAAMPRGLLRAAEGRKWILPTDTPDRHHLKVMAFNPIPRPTHAPGSSRSGAWSRSPCGSRYRISPSPRITQSSRLKCVQCWSGRVLWEGFRCMSCSSSRAKSTRTWCIDCATATRLREHGGPAPPADAVRGGHERRAAHPEHGAPLWLVMPHSTDIRSSKLITADLGNTWCQGMVADAWPSYYSPTGNIEAGLDHPFEFPGEARKIARRDPGLLAPDGLPRRQASERQDDVAVDVGEAVVPPLELEGQLRVAEAQQVEHRGVQIVDVHGIFDGVVAELVRRATVIPPLIPPPAIQIEGAGVVVPAQELRVVAPSFMGCGRTPRPRPRPSSRAGRAASSPSPGPRLDRPRGTGRAAG